MDHIGFSKELFDNNYKSLCVYAHSYTKDMDLAKDIAQDVFIKVWEDKIIFKSKEHVTGFLYKSIKNKCLNILKSKKYKIKKHRSVRFDLLHDLAENVNDTKIDIKIQRLKEGINMLPKKMRECLIYTSTGFTNKQIALVTGTTINTVKDYKKIGYAKIRKYLNSKFMDIE